MKNKNKDKKIHESWIGKIIYGFLMFIPLLTILFTSLYTTFNKNAYQSYYGETINEQEIKNVNNFNVKTIYTLNYNNNSLISQNATLYLDTITFYAVPNNNVSNMNTNSESIKSLYFFQANNIQYCVFRDIDNNSIGVNIPLNNSLLKFDYKWINNSTNTNVNEWLKNNSTYIEYNKYSYLDNSFEYGIYKTSNSPLFNWTKNSIIYTGLSATTQSLNIETEFIPMLLTYWLIISLLYMLYDIILVIFHVLHRKIHNLEESI